MMIQHIRRRIRQNTFESIEQGHRTFEVGAGNQEIAVGDMITFEEKDEEGNLTGRRLTRKVSYVINTNEVPFLKEQAEKNGLVVLGMVSPIYQTLGSVFANFFCIALGIEVHSTTEDDKKRIEIAEGPHYLPPFVCPAVDPEILVRGNLKAQNWPPGVYSAMLQGIEEDGLMSIVDTLVITFVPDEEDDIPKSTIIKIEPLMASGKAIDVHNRVVEPVTPEMMHEHEESLFLAEYNHQEGEALFPDDVIMGNFDRQPQPED
jgi:hypothetical protein